ncbi:hypothetical protein J2S75_000678 [Ancylobacter polymorphus]|uniref:Uncharacterized protein n=1 Tax=Ancylobacter polymorphus TaxID=223390 RepID=A0ABU0B765_9HYPH|nr:hypothetical protein [Ancylobacter polymorphus]
MSIELGPGQSKGAAAFPHCRGRPSRGRPLRSRGFDEVGGDLRILIGVVDREHHIVFAQRLKRRDQCSRVTYARGGDGDVAFDDRRGKGVRRERLAEIEFPSAVEAPEQEGQCLAHMAENDLRLGKAGECSAEDKPQCMGCGLGRPGPDRTTDFGAMGEHGRMVGHGAGMQIDRDVQFLDTLPEGQIAVLVEIMPVGLAVDERSPETELPDGTFEFGRSGLGILQGEMSKAGIAIGPLLNLARKEIIGAVGEPDGFLRIAHALDPRRGDREHHQINAGSVHHLKPHLVEVGQATFDIRKKRVAPGRSCHVFPELRGSEMLFKRDLAHVPLLYDCRCRMAPPSDYGLGAGHASAGDLVILS